MTPATMNEITNSVCERLARSKLLYIEDIIFKCEAFSSSILQKNSSGEKKVLFQDLCCIIHSMKGTAAMYEIAMISAICHRFEDYLLSDGIAEDMNNDFVIDRILQYFDLINLSAVIEKHNISA